MNNADPSELTRDELATVLEKNHWLVVRPSSLLMTISFAVLSLAHLLILRPPQAYVMAVLATATALACGWIWRFEVRLRNNLRSHDVLGILALLSLLNVSTHMAIDGDPLQSTYFAIFILACGFLMVDRTWFIASLTAYVVVWWLVYQRLPPAQNSYHFEYLIAVSSVTAVIAYITRGRWIRRMESAAIIGERRSAQMEAKLRQQQEELTHVSRLITMGELVASIAHELNQPLSAISNYATACKLQLQRSDIEDETIRLQLDRIGETAVRAGSIIKRLRSLASKSSTVRSGIDLNEVIRDAAAMVSMDSRYDAVELEMDLAANLPKVRADEIQIQQVIMNLLQNGVDSLRESPHPPRVMLKSAMSSDGLQVSVVDNGPGLRAADPESVFDAFCTTKPNGMGMGLAICRSIVESHGGRIWCCSNDLADEQQTAFHFSIPILDGVEV